MPLPPFHPDDDPLTDERDAQREARDYIEEMAEPDWPSKQEQREAETDKFVPDPNDTPTQQEN